MTSSRNTAYRRHSAVRRIGNAEPSPSPRAQVKRRRQTFGQRQFELLVQQAVDGLPLALKQLLGDIPVIAEDEPSPEDLESTGTPPGETLLGMYHGTPLTERMAGYGMVIPDRITIYRIPIESDCETRREVISEIRRTLVHELAHHYGLSEERLAQFGWD